MYKSKKIIILMFLLCLATALAAAGFNYGEALQKTIYFFECQQAGPLPSWNRVEWRGDATLKDEITGGLYDAGDHVKFNLPMAYSASMLGWAGYEYKAAFQNSGQWVHLSNNLKFILDYLMACSNSSSYVYQVGKGSSDHSWWGPVEVIEKEPMAGVRPSLKAASGISCVMAQSAAALALGNIVLGTASYLDRAKSLFSKAAADESDAVYKASEAANFYNSHSGPVDELLWAAVWLYVATNDSSYLSKAEAYVSKLNRQPNSNTQLIEYRWGHCWDDSHYGAMVMLSKLTGKQEYKDFVQMHLDWWTSGFNGERVDYSPGGLAWLTSWGALRHATASAFLAFVYGDWVTDTALKQKYLAFAEKQTNYVLGSNPRSSSYIIGFGSNYPKHPHHRTAHSSWTDSMNEPPNHRHILYGAMVGGPDVSDGYKDEITDYVMNEVACDYNAGVVGCLARMYNAYGGSPLSNFPQPETREDEFFAEAKGSAGSTSTDLTIQTNNRSGWPARMVQNLKFRYFMDLSEIISAGGASALTVASYYQEFPVTISAPTRWSGNIYYLEVVFKDGTSIYPGGVSEYAGEVQLRISGPSGWDAANDPSFKGLSGSAYVKTQYIPVYDGNTLLYGLEPGQTPAPTRTQTPSRTPTSSIPTPTTRTPTPTQGATPGDVNGDGVINIVDALMTAQYSVGLSPQGFLSARADTNCDGTINIIDALIIAQYSVGLISRFC